MRIRDCSSTLARNVRKEKGAGGGGNKSPSKGELCFVRRAACTAAGWGEVLATHLGAASLRGKKGQEN